MRVAGGILAASLIVLGMLSLVWCYAGSASVNAELKEVGDLFVQLSPSDPQTHFAAAVLHEKALETGDIDIALREYETAAALAPNNYLLWVSLGSARGRVGDVEGAEAALRRAHKLAPNYARVNWALGNFLLRQGNDDEAFALLTKAVDGDALFASNAASIALIVSDGNVASIQQHFHGNRRINIALSRLLAGEKRFDEAMSIWKDIPVVPNDQLYADAAKDLRKIMVDNRRFQNAVTLYADGVTNGETPTVDKIMNAGFESPVRTDNQYPFDWKITRATYPQIAVTDSQKLAGRYSLIVALSGNQHKEFRGFSQLVAVRPASNYELKLNSRSDATSKAEFMWEILSADGKRLAISPAIQPSKEWAPIVVGFSVPEGIDGIEIKLVRGECIASACSANGSIWFDEFSLTAK